MADSFTINWDSYKWAFYKGQIDEDHIRSFIRAHKNRFTDSPDNIINGLKDLFQQWGTKGTQKTHIVEKITEIQQ